MAFDAGMLAAAVTEIGGVAIGGRIEKVYQPQNDEVVLLLRSREGGRRILLRCGANDPRIGFTSVSRDNPAVPPTLCMLLRKHLQGSVLSSVTQEGFERVAVFEFDARDEMGFDCKKYLIAEVMGKNSNLIFTDENKRILAAMRTVDFTTSRLRQVLPGMTYELPPAQKGKRDPRGETEEGFYTAYGEASPDSDTAKFINGVYLGICPAVAREIVYRATGRIDSACREADPTRLWRVFWGVFADVSSGRFVPSLAYDGSRPIEYSYLPLTQYGGENCRICATCGEALDIFYGERDRASHVASRAADLQHALTLAIARIGRKLEVQRRELAACAEGETYKSDADLITANIYRLRRGDGEVALTDYDRALPDGGFEERVLTLDTRLTPAANAQRLYKKYTKCINAHRELTRQIELGEKESEYLQSVADALSRCETAADFAGVRDELEHAGYLRAKKGAPLLRSQKSQPAVYRTIGGYTVLCGKNNYQNDELTLRRASGDDIWFHAKGVPGSHVILLTGGDDVPDADMTEAAQIAAYNSKAVGGDNVAVDYTAVRNIKKPSGAKPGFVIYRTNSTAYVTPDAEKISVMRQKA